MTTCLIEVTTCLIEGCERKAKTRGLCDPCYQAALTAVKKRQVTWDQLIDMGLAKPATKVSIAGAGAFAAALAEKKAALLPESKQPLDGNTVVIETPDWAPPEEESKDCPTPWKK